MAKKKKFTRSRFEMIVVRNKKTFAELQEEFAKGLIDEHAYLFTLDGVADISYAAYCGGWNNCQMVEKPKGKWSDESRSTSGRLIIKDAFT